MFNFAERDRVSEDNYFVVDYVEAPGPFGMVFHRLMNFKNVDKLLAYVKDEVVLPAVHEVLETSSNVIEEDSLKLISIIKSMGPDETAAETLAFWDEINDIIDKCDNKWVRLKDFRDRFETFFYDASPSTYGLELIAPEESLIDFWCEFFDDDEEEIENIKTAYKTGDPHYLDKAILNHAC